MEETRLLKKIVAKQIFDEYSILAKEILNIVSVALALKSEGDVRELKNKALDYIENYKYLEIGKFSIDTLKSSKLINEVVDILAYNTENIEPMFRINYLFIDSKKTFLTSTEILIDTLLYLYKRCNISKVILDVYMFPNNFRILGNIDEKRKFALFKKRKKLIGFSKTDELILLSFFFKDIENILNSLNLVAKYLKFKRESSRQVYIPFPLLQRRYRIYNLQAFLNDELVKVINSLIGNQPKIFKQNEKLSFVLTSDYNIGDKVNEYGENTALIKGSFFWREMLRLFPIIMNVFAVKLLNILTPRKKQILKDIVDFLHSRIYKNIFIRDDIFFSKLELEKLTQDIFSDIISFLIFGDSYILSLVSSGVLGNRYYDTLGINNKELDERENIKKLWIDFEYLYEDIMFDTERESSLIRLKVLIDIREYIKQNSKKYNLFELSLLDSQKPVSILDEIKEYMNDLFPIWEKIPVGDTYKRLSIYQKKSVKLIGNLINFVSKVYVKKLKEFLSDIKFSLKEKFLGIYIDRAKFTDESLYFFVKTYKVNIKRENIENPFYKVELKNNYIDISIIPNPAFLDFRNLNKVSLLAIVWKNLINKLTKRSKTLSYGIYEGSMLRSIVNIKKYNEFIKDSVSFEYDYLNFLKAKRFFESFKDKQITFRDSIKNYSFYTRKKLKTLLMSDFTSLFLSKDMYGTDIWEVRIYKDAIRNLGFLDRHSLLKAKSKKIKYERNWIVFTLVKFSKKFREFKRELKKSLFIDNEKEVFIREIKELVEDYNIREKFFGFSLGWEDLILYYEDNCLSNIFEFMEKLQDFTIIQRTETIIGFNMEKNKPLCLNNSKHERNFHLYMFARLKHTDKKLEEINISELNSDNFIKNCNIFPEIYPGRFDMILSKKYLKEEEVINCLNKVLNTRSITLKLGRNKSFYIEDLVLKITSISDFYT
ncbi:MAG: hypothetical protein DSY59_04305 [Persephonella sp.]|nr:MAG: hypothetical protein DSY59_04305 [Persephonella sp.]